MQGSQNGREECSMYCNEASEHRGSGCLQQPRPPWAMTLFVRDFSSALQWDFACEPQPVTNSCSTQQRQQNQR